jgi:hypothetical protein
MKTRSEIITRACRQVRIVAVDRVPDGDTHANASDVLDGLVAEVGMDFTSEEVDDEMYLALAGFLAAELAPQYGLPGPSRNTQKLRVQALMEGPVPAERDLTALQAQYY